MISIAAQRSVFMEGRRLYKFQVTKKLSISRKRPMRVSVGFSFQKADRSIKVGILGANELSAGQLIPFIANHPFLDITLMTADNEAGQSIGSVFPHLTTHDMPNMIALQDADFSSVDVVFSCLPTHTSQEIIKGLPSRLKIVDLSAPHKASELQDADTSIVNAVFCCLPPDTSQKEVVYGLTEIHRKKIQGARLVANPGCYPTAILLPLVPLIKANLIASQDIIIFSNSGVSETVPEVEQELSEAANSEVTFSFISTQKLMSQGMDLTINVRMAPEASVEDLKQHLMGFYEKEEFVVLLEGNKAPHTEDVRGSNGCHINVFRDGIPGRAIIISVMDKLIKGASGQALQNLNLMMGIPENVGLSRMPLLP